MNYAAVKYCDISNGTGCRTVLFVSGCRNRCKGCFQPETWDFHYGRPFDSIIQKEILKSLEANYISGLTVLGGEPFEPENQRGLVPFLRKVKKEFPGKSIWAYTGYLLDVDLAEGGKKYTEDTDGCLDCIDVLVDGLFVEEMKNISLAFRGSENQRLIDMKASRKEQKVILYKL